MFLVDPAIPFLFSGVADKLQRSALFEALLYESKITHMTTKY